MTTKTQELSTDIVVIGAGLTGLTTAHYLKKNKRDFIVLEKELKVGGVIQSTREGDFLYENGPNTGVVGNSTVVEVFEDLAARCEPEIGGKNVNKRFILKNGKWESLPQGPVSAIKTPLFTLKDKFRILGEPFRAPGKDPHENLASFVKRRLGQSFLNYAIDPFIIGVYAGDPNHLILKYALPKLYNLEQNYGSLVGGSFKKGFEKKSPEEKKVTRKVFSMKEGLGSLTNALCESAGKDQFILGALDIAVEHHDSGYLVTYKNDQGETFSIKAKQVITTVGAYSLPAILPFVDKAAMSKIESLLYTKVIEVTLGFNKWEGFELDGFGGLIPSIEKRDILGILFMSALFGNRAPEGGALLSIFMGGVRRQDLMTLDDKAIRKLLEKECKELMNLKTFEPDFIKIKRHHKAIPQYGIESGDRFATVEALEKQYPGLQIGGNLRGGIGMADRMKQGKELAMKAIQG